MCACRSLFTRPLVPTPLSLDRCPGFSQLPHLLSTQFLIHTSPAQSFLWGTCLVALCSESSSLLLLAR